MQDLQKEQLRLANSGSQYESMADEIFRLREAKRNVLIQNADCQTKHQRIAEMTEFLKSQTGVISQYDDKLIGIGVVQRLLFRIVDFKHKMLNDKSIILDALYDDAVRDINIHDLRRLIKKFQSVAGDTFKDYVANLFINFHQEDPVYTLRLLTSIQPLFLSCNLMP